MTTPAEDGIKGVLQRLDSPPVFVLYHVGVEVPVEVTAHVDSLFVPTVFRPS